MPEYLEEMKLTFAWNEIEFLYVRRVIIDNPGDGFNVRLVHDFFVNIHNGDTDQLHSSHCIAHFTV